MSKFKKLNNLFLNTDRLDTRLGYRVLLGTVEVINHTTFVEPFFTIGSRAFTTLCNVFFFWQKTFPINEKQILSKLSSTTILINSQFQCSRRVSIKAVIARSPSLPCNLCSRGTHTRWFYIGNVLLVLF